MRGTYGGQKSDTELHAKKGGRADEVNVVRSVVEAASEAVGLTGADSSTHSGAHSDADSGADSSGDVGALMADHNEKAATAKISKTQCLHARRSNIVQSAVHMYVVLE